MRVYLDHNATTPVRPEVVAAMAACLSGDPGNPSSLHGYGRAAARLREEARRTLAGAAGCDPEEVVFTSGGTEADNLVLRGSLAPGRSHLVTAATEHEAVLHTAQALEAAGARLTVVGVDADGLVDPAAVRAAIRPDTALVSIMAANNETGVLAPIGEIGQACRVAGVPLHVDAVQFFGKEPFAFGSLPVEFASISAHKIGGPKGIGALLVRRGRRLSPQVTGGGQERRVRPGTENLPGMVGFAEAARSAVEGLDADVARVSALRDRLERGILAAAPGSRVNGAGAPRLSNTSNVSFAGLDGETLLVALDLLGVAVSTGAACNAGATEPSHVLLAMGRSREEAAGSIRFSLGPATTEADIQYVLEALEEVLARVTSTGPRRDRGGAIPGSRP